MKTDVEEDSPNDERSRENKGKNGSRPISWAMMLGLVLLAILVAAGFAYLLVDPFFHQHPH